MIYYNNLKKLICIIFTCRLPLWFRQHLIIRFNFAIVVLSPLIVCQNWKSMTGKFIMLYFGIKTHRVEGIIRKPFAVICIHFFFIQLFKHKIYVIPKRFVLGLWYIKQKNNREKYGKRKAVKIFNDIFITKIVQIDHWIKLIDRASVSISKEYLLYHFSIGLLSHLDKSSNE